MYERLHAQRRSHPEGKLAPEKVAVSRGAAGWSTAGNFTASWDTRLREVEGSGWSRGGSRSTTGMTAGREGLGDLVGPSAHLVAEEHLESWTMTDSGRGPHRWNPRFPYTCTGQSLHLIILVGATSMVSARRLGVGWAAGYGLRRL